MSYHLCPDIVSPWSPRPNMSVPMKRPSTLVYLTCWLASKTEVYNATISKINANAQTYTGEFGFIEDYEYKLGADQLTSFGEQQMVDSGIKFYHRYESLAREFLPFFRSSGEERVVQSADNFTQGFHAAKLAGRCKDPAYPYPLVVIPEGDGINNVGFEASNLARTGCS